jgi:hypothetical protein
MCFALLYTQAPPGPGRGQSDVLCAIPGISTLPR